MRHDLYRILAALKADGIISALDLADLDQDFASIYVHTALARNITAQHTFVPGTAQAPFLLGTNAQGQLVTGLNADQLEGKHATVASTAASIPIADGSGDIADTWLTANIARLNTAQTWLAEQLMLLKTYAHGSLPAAATEGRVMYDTTNDRLMVDTGSAIIPNFGKQYGNLYIDDNTGPVTFALNAGTPKVVEWATAGLANEVTQDVVTNYDLEVDDAGIYLILVHLSFSATGAGQVYEGHLFKNGTIREECGFHRKIATANDVGNVNAHTVVSLAAGDDMDFRLDCASGTPNVTVDDGQFTILRIG
jgi:hypothetical protein